MKILKCKPKHFITVIDYDLKCILTKKDSFYFDYIDFEYNENCEIQTLWVFKSGILVGQLYFDTNEKIKIERNNRIKVINCNRRLEALIATYNDTCQIDERFKQFRQQLTKLN